MSSFVCLKILVPSWWRSGLRCLIQQIGLVCSHLPHILPERGDFHPTSVDVTWTRNEQPVGEGTVSQIQYHSNENFSFRIFSYLSITPQEGDIYSCSVGHVSLQEPLTRIWCESLLV
uniref:Ig-like domain-containing protein n=1 Tax=Salmo trutta TaxID=8032 RepID=A0A674CB99_SALTR